MDKAQKNSSDTLKKRFFEDGKSFVIAQIEKVQHLDSKGAENLLSKYLVPELSYEEGLKIQDVYKRLIMSSQNANMRAGVISGALDGGIESLGMVLCDFDPAQFALKNLKPEELLEEIRVQLKPRGEVRDGPRSIWPQFCKTAIAGANFLNQFVDVNDFVSWARHFYDDKRSIAALPLLIQQEIPGFGYALACDFLKELGFVNFGKPDVHIKEIFTGCGLCEEKPTEYALQKTIMRIATVSNTTPFAVDRVFWLIGSGRIGEINFGGKKQEFIKKFNQSN